MARLGKNQLDLLAGLVGPRRAAIVGDKLTRSLAKSGYLRSLGDDSFYIVTSDGLRAVADALDSGALKPATMEDFKPRKDGC